MAVQRSSVGDPAQHLPRLRLCRGLPGKIFPVLLFRNQEKSGGFNVTSRHEVGLSVRMKLAEDMQALTLRS